MSDRFLLEPICFDCGAKLYDNQESIMPFMIAVGESLDLRCDKCNTVWRFWIGIKTCQKRIKSNMEKI